MSQFFPIKSIRCCHCRKDFFVTVDMGKHQEGVCGQCLRLPHLEKIKASIDDIMRDIRPRRWLAHLRAGIAAG